MQKYLELKDQKNSVFAQLKVLTEEEKLELNQIYSACKNKFNNKNGVIPESRFENFKKEYHARSNHILSSSDRLLKEQYKKIKKQILAQNSK